MPHVWLPVSEDLVVLLWPFLWAYGYNDQYVVAVRRTDLPDDNEHWASVVGFVRRHGLVLLHETGIADVAAAVDSQILVWTTPGRRLQVTAGELGQGEIAADLERIEAEIRRKHDVPDEYVPKLRLR